MRFMPIQSTIERGRETMYNVSGQFSTRDTKGGRMKRGALLKPRETETRPPEELFRILCRIYPLEIAQEVFERLVKGMEKQNERS